MPTHWNKLGALRSAVRAKHLIIASTGKFQSYFVPSRYKCEWDGQVLYTTVCCTLEYNLYWSSLCSCKCCCEKHHRTSRRLHMNHRIAMLPCTQVGYKQWWDRLYDIQTDQLYLRIDRAGITHLSILKARRCWNSCRQNNQWYTLHHLH